MQQRHHIVLAGVVLLFCTASNLAAPVLSGMLLDILVQQQPLANYTKVFFILLAGYVLEPLLTRVYMTQLLAAGEKALATLRLELFRTLLMQRIQFYDTHPPSELTALISSELDTMRQFIFNMVSRDRGPRAVLEAVGAVVVLFCLSWQLAPICSAIVIATALAAASYRRRTKEVEGRQAGALQQMGAVAFQAFDNIRTVRSFAGESMERERFHAQVRESYGAGVQFAEAKAELEATNRWAIHASLLALYAWGGWLVAQGLMPVGTMLSAIGFTFSLTFATQGVVNSLSELRRVAGAVSRVRAIIQASDPDPSMFGALPPGAWWEVANGGKQDLQPYGQAAGERALEAARRGDLELRGVHFSYPVRQDVPVLQSVDLRLRHGTVTALVGRSGAGKSTVAAILSRFYEPQVGQVLLDGVPASEYTRGEWAKAVAMVSQEPVLFAGTIAENIAYGRWGQVGRKEVEAAAKAANVHEFVHALPQGYDTIVGERGTLLSGGQRQRIAIARALLKDSPVIILDEATSALDGVSEKLVQQALKRLVRGRTVLVIAHRLSTVQNADNIVVMVNGQVEEQGTHEQLLELGGHYVRLMSSKDLILGAT